MWRRRDRQPKPCESFKFLFEVPLPGPQTRSGESDHVTRLSVPTGARHFLRLLAGRKAAPQFSWQPNKCPPPRHTHLHVQGLLVCGGVDGHRLQAQLLAGADDAHRNLATVSNQDLLEAGLRADATCCPADTLRAGRPAGAAAPTAAGSKVCLCIAQECAAGGLAGLLLGNLTAGGGPAGEGCLARAGVG